jgi:hypothetical protein
VIFLDPAEYLAAHPMPAATPDTRRHIHMITIRPERIGPDLATEYLDTNTANWRKPSPAAVKRLAADMLADRWVEDTGTIDFTEDGKLADGQHRLMAVVESGRTIKFMVRRNVPLEVIEHIDMGRKRHLADLLAHRGEVNTSTLAAMLATHWRWAHGVLAHGGWTAPSHPALTAWLDEHPEIRDFPRRGMALRRAFGYKSVIGGVLTYELSRIDAAEAEAFERQLMAGTHLADDSPLLALRRQVARQVASRSHSIQVDDLALGVKCWNAWTQGQSTKLLVWRRGGSRPEPFPTLLDLQGQPWTVT